MEEFSQAEGLYYHLAAGDRRRIEVVTGCLLPCSYTEYNLVSSRPIKSPWATSATIMFFGNLATRVRKEVYVYSFLDLVSDFGGSLGLFIGFSFFSLWDTAKDILMLQGATLRKLYKVNFKKPHKFDCK